MSVPVSVFIPAHNPRMDYLARVLAALRAQTLDKSQWQLVVVDNKSSSPLKDGLDLSWHPAASIVREEALGLARARMRGFGETQGGIVVMVDDDNVLDADYLQRVLEIGQTHPHIGSWSGAMRPEFEDSGFCLTPDLAALLTLREVTADIWSNDISHHASTPWGAGFCARRAVVDAYCRDVSGNPERLKLDLQGTTLLYGGDTDIAYAGCRAGYGKGVFASLRLTHLIPRERCSVAHLCKVARGRGYSEVLHTYLNSGALPAPQGGMARQLLRLLRDMRKPPLQRAVALAYARGVAQAMRDLARA